MKKKWKDEEGEREGGRGSGLGTSSRAALCRWVGERGEARGGGRVRASFLTGLQRGSPGQCLKVMLKTSPVFMISL